MDNALGYAFVKIPITAENNSGFFLSMQNIIQLGDKTITIIIVIEFSLMK